jgi:hypothetical protein
MLRVVRVMLTIALGASAASAQGPAQQEPVNLTMSLQRSYAAIKNNLTLAADKLPQADYGFKPSTMAEVRTFGQLFGHVANAQFNACATARGMANPNMGVNNEQKTEKAEIVKALADSFAFCDPAFAALTEASGTEMVQGRGRMARSAVLAGLIAHSNEMYGTAGVYLRAKNIVPPSSEGGQAAPGGGRGGRGRGGE